MGTYPVRDNVTKPLMMTVKSNGHAKPQHFLALICQVVGEHEESPRRGRVQLL